MEQMNCNKKGVNILYENGRKNTFMDTIGTAYTYRDKNIDCILNYLLETPDYVSNF